jgi:transketolase
VLSKGHCVPAQYFCMAKAGFFPSDLLVTLRKLGSPLQGHPDCVALPGIVVTQRESPEYQFTAATCR